MIIYCMMIPRYIADAFLLASNAFLNGNLQITLLNCLRSTQKDAIIIEKCQRLLQQLDAMKQHVRQTLNFCDAFEAILLIGATAVSVKEVFSINIKFSRG